jgi:hypothetical protein
MDLTPEKQTRGAILMGIIETFTVTFIEEICVFILWSRVGLRDKNNFFINVIIIVIGTLVTSLTGFNIYLNAGISYFTIIFLVCILYKKKIIITTIEFFIIAAFIIIMQLIGIFIYNKYIGKYQGEFSMNIIIQLMILFFLLGINYFIPIIKEHLNYDINKKILFYLIINLLSYILIIKIITI